MKKSSRLGSYAQLLMLNGRLFLERLKLDAAILLFGLVYTFGGQNELDLTVGKGVFLLVGFLLTAVMESHVIKTNTAQLSFYLRLPIHRRMTLAAFLLVFILPSIVIYTVLLLLFRFILLSADMPIEPSLLTRRYFEVVFAILFMKSLTINIMIAMSIHYALIGGYFLFLSAVLLVLSILRELVTPLFAMTNFTVALLFLLSTYVIGFVAVKRIGL